MKLLPCTDGALVFNLIYCTFCAVFIAVILHFAVTYIRFTPKQDHTTSTKKRKCNTICSDKCMSTFMISFSFGCIAARAVYVFHEDGCYGWSHDSDQVANLRNIYS